MDPGEYSEAAERLEREYLAGGMSADEYTRRRRRLEEGISPPEAEARPVLLAASEQPVARGADPVTGAELASWGRRAAALLLDWVIVIMLVYAVLIVDFLSTNAVTGDYVGIVILGAPLVYAWLMVGRFGQTLGKMAVGIHVVRAEDARRVGYPRSAGRVGATWVLAFLFIPLVIAWLWPLWDRRNQTLYDKIAGTIVIRSGTRPAGSVDGAS